MPQAKNTATFTIVWRDANDLAVNPDSGASTVVKVYDRDRAQVGSTQTYTNDSAERTATGTFVCTFTHDTPGMYMAEAVTTIDGVQQAVRTEFPLTW